MTPHKSVRRRPSRLANRLATRLRRALHGEAGAGVLLMLAAAVAMALANSPWAHDWHALWHEPLARTPLPALDTLGHWIDDGLMAVFFFAIGLEIKREAVAGDLSHPRHRRLPALAAAMGMAAPALVYLAVARGHPALTPGWAIPAATDIAFALGVLGLAGKGLPGSLRLFLLGLAVVDDLGAVAIIALFYGGAIHAGWLAAGAVVLAALVALNLAGSRRGPLYILGAVALWYCVLHSGVHATVAGVLAALTVPVRIRSHGDSLLLRIEHAVAPWCSYAIAPLFALASAGVSLDEVSGGSDTEDSGGHLVALAVAAGLVVGKQLGVLGAVILAERTGFVRAPEGATRLELWGVGLLAGIGFTMSLFIAALAFPQSPELAAEARLGILAGSLVSALAGFVVLRVAARRRAVASPLA